MGFLRHARRAQRQGIVLVAVLLLVLLLAAVLIEFNYEARLNLEAGANTCGSRQALAVAESGLGIALAAVRQQKDLALDEPSVRLLSGAAPVRVGEGTCAVTLAGENGKMNIGLLKTRAGRVDERRVGQFLRLIDALNAQPGRPEPIGYGIVAAVIDWTDEDDDVTRLASVRQENEGAEEGDYARLDPPRHCKNAPFDTIEELLSVRGVTPLILNGRPADDAQSVTALSGLREFVTIYGDGRIDLNHAPAAVLQSLSEKIDATLAGEIVRRRQEQPFRFVAELRAVRGMTPELFGAIQELVTTAPAARYYQVDATGVVGDFTRRIRAVMKLSGSAGDVEIVQRQEL